MDSIIDSIKCYQAPQRAGQRVLLKFDSVVLCSLHDAENCIWAQSVIISQHLLMDLSVSHWQRHCHIRDNRNTFEYARAGLHTHQPARAQDTHTCNVCTPETHPPSTLGFARDKQPRCEVRSVYLSRRRTVSVWGCGEWGIEMARWHRMPAQTDFAKAACPQIITFVSQHPRHLSTSQRLRSAAWAPKDELHSWIQS